MDRLDKEADPDPWMFQLASVKERLAEVLPMPIDPV